MCKGGANMALKPKHIAYIEALLANPALSNTEVAELIGINRNTVTQWKKNPEIQQELERRLKEKWKDTERLAMDTMQKLAREGDFKASKYILDSLGYAPTQRIEADVSGSMDITIDIQD